jgi:sugar phosphate isomerase/epimerase
VPSYHPRLALSSVCTFAWSLDEDLRLWERLGADYVAVALPTMDVVGLDRAVSALQAAGLRIENLIGVSPFALDRPESWAQHYGRMHEYVGAAAALGAESLLFTTGPFGSLRWEEAAAAFAEAFGPVLEWGVSSAIPIGLENSGALRYENGFVTTLRDTVDLARSLGATVCVETWNCWPERNLAGTFQEAAGMFSVIQLSDYVAGTCDTPNRAVPGDGMMPIARIVADAEAAGYRGPYELEILGPRIDAEGPANAVARGLRALDGLLAGVGIATG